MKRVLSLVCCLAALAMGAAAQGTIRIATAGPITGDGAIWGLQVYRGVELAVEDINARGGLLGRKIEIVKYDDKGEPMEAASAAQRIVSDKSIVAVIGHVYSSCSMAAGPIYSRSRVPMVAVASTNPKVPTTGAYVYRINLSDSSAGAEMAKYTVANLGKKKIAVILDQNDYCQGVYTAFSAKAQELGARIVSVQKFVGGQDKDFNVQLTSVKAAKPDIILIDAYSTEAALIAQQARALGIDTPLEIPDGATNPDYVKLAGKAAEGTYAFSYFDPTIADRRIQDLSARYKAKYREEMQTYVPYAYDAVTAVAEAVRISGKADRAAIQAGLPKVRYADGLTGEISFVNRDRAVGWSVVLQVRDGAFRFLELTSGK